jgi:hypothetical protein
MIINLMCLSVCSLFTGVGVAIPQGESEEHQSIACHSDDAEAAQGAGWWHFLEEGGLEKVTRSAT